MELAKRTVREAIIYSAQPIFEKLIAIVLVPLYTGFLTPADYGTISFIMAVGCLFSPIINLGMGSSFWKYYSSADNSENQGKVIYWLATSTFIAGLIALIIISITAITTELFKNANLVILYLAGLISFNLFTNALTVMRAKHKAGIYLLSSISGSVFRVILNILLVGVLYLGYTGAIYAKVLTFAATGFMGYLYLRRHWIQPKNKSLFFEMFKYGMPLMLGNISALLITLTDKFALNYMVGKEELGLYTFAANFSLLMRGFLLVPFFMGWNPVRWEIFHRSDGRNILASIARPFAVIVPSLSFIIGGIAIMAATLLSRSTDYLVSLNAVPVLSLAYGLWGIFYFDQMGLLFTDRTKTIAYLVTGGGLLNLFLNIVLIPRMGYMGAAIATLISYLMLRTLTLYLSQKFYNIKRKALKETIYILLCSIMAIFSITISHYVDGIVYAFILILIGIILFAIGLLLGVTEQKDISYLAKKFVSSLSDMIGKLR